MMVCHCMSISDREIRAAVDWMRASDPDTLITPGKVYRALGKRPDCGGCLPVFLQTMSACESFGIPRELVGLGRVRRSGVTDEGRPRGHRLLEQGAEK